MSLLLIFPPFTGVNGIHGAIPYLTSYLRSKGAQVSSFDANNEFFRFFLTGKNITDGMDQTIELLKELDGTTTLTDKEGLSYLWNSKALLDASDLPPHWEQGIFEPWGAITREKYMGRFAAFSAALPLASAPYPEKIECFNLVGSIHFHSPLSGYSSRQVFQGLEGGNPLSSFFETVLPDILKRESPRLVGISISFVDQVHAAFRCASVIKTLDPDVHVTIGGTFVSSCMQHTVHDRVFKIIDSMVIGDGEIPLEKMVHEFSTSQPDLSRIPGLIYKENGSIRRNDAAPPLAMETCPPPDYSDIQGSCIFPMRALWQHIRSSRGCWWKKCAFCRTEMSQVKDHQQPKAEYIFELIRSVLAQTGNINFGFVDEAADPRIMETAAQWLLNDRVYIKWACNMRLEKEVTLERCLLYRKSGCIDLNFGLETYNNRLLKLITKGTNTKTIDNVLSNASWAGLHSLVYMIVGLPTETEEEALKSFEKIKKLKDDGTLSFYNYSLFELLPGSDMYNTPEKYGITNIVPDPDKDFGAMVENYDRTGIPVTMAAFLRNRFNSYQNPRAFRQEFMVNGRTVCLKHDLQELHNRLFLGLAAENGNRRGATEQ